MTEAAKIEMKTGNLYLSNQDRARSFSQIESLVLLRDGDDLLIVPVRFAAAGGYILKIRNSAGDRVVVATDFFPVNNFDDDEPRVLNATWDETRAALRIPALFNN